MQHDDDLTSWGSIWSALHIALAVDYIDFTFFIQASPHYFIWIRTILHNHLSPNHCSRVVPPSTGIRFEIAHQS